MGILLGIAAIVIVGMIFSFLTTPDKEKIKKLREETKKMEEELEKSEDSLGKYMFTDTGKYLGNMNKFEGSNNIVIAVYERGLLISNKKVTDDFYEVRNNSIQSCDVVTETTIRETPSLAKLAVFGFLALGMKGKETTKIKNYTILKVGVNTIIYEASVKSERLARRVEKIINERENTRAVE